MRMRNACKMLVEKHEERHQIEDLGVDGNIILKDLGVTGWEGVYWMHLTQDGLSGGLL
jgi:hypothetical protein